MATCAREDISTADVGRVELADLELETMEEMAVFASQQRNSITGACRLPKEALTSIFSFAQAGWSPGQVHNHSVYPTESHWSLGWMDVTHVCSVWRKTALETPSLWCHLSCMDLHPLSIPTLLTRSRGLPLSIFVGGRSLPIDCEDLEVNATSSWLSKAVLRRTRQLVFEGVPDSYQKLWLESLHHPMPLIETFSVKHPRRLDEQDITATISSGLFSGSAPALRNVTLHSAILSWDSVWFSHNLVSLNLYSDDYPDLGRGPLPHPGAPSQQFYETLSSMMCLESLSLHNIYPALPELDNPQADWRVTLPAGFSTLDLHASCRYAELCIDFFNRLSVPFSARVLLQVHTEKPVAFVEQFATPIERLFGLLDSDNVSSLIFSKFIIQSQSPAQDTLSLLRRRFSDSMMSSMNWAWCSVYAGAKCLWTIPDDSDLEASLLPHIPLLPLNALQTITIASNAAQALSSPESWINNFSSAHSVHSLSIDYYDTLVLFDALTTTDAVVSNAPAEPAVFSLFPCLTTIILHVDPEEERSEDTLVELCTALDVSLVDLLQIRKEKGAPLQTILVSDGLSQWDVWSRAEDMTSVEFFRVVSGIM
ncbi:hypothetical protein PENSPDRAFT_757982 [Peniophora sp. CONT]|nr:hypothetical protein PENSPDRAFT_757982 [Peniophora sp. CONT]